MHDGASLGKEKKDGLCALLCSKAEVVEDEVKVGVIGETIQASAAAAVGVF